MIEKTQQINNQLNTHRRYNARFVGVSKELRKDFQNSKCVLPISVGQQYHEGEKFNASIKLVNKNFSSCTILVGDTLQRHTLYINNQDKSKDELYALAKNAGDLWIERNMQYISKLTIPYRISRWDEWIGQARYQYYFKKVYELYNDDSEYKNVVDEIAHQFLFNRDCLDNQNKLAALDSCIQYILEESAGACLWVEYDHRFDVYPSGSILSMVMACNKFLPDKNAQSLKFKIERMDKSSDSVLALKAENYKDIATNYILTHIPGHIYWKNLDGVLLGCNVEHAKYFGFDNPDDIIGKTNKDVIDEENAASVSEADMKVMTTGAENVVEEFNGTEYFLSKKVPLRDSNNKIIGLLGTSINITEQKKLEFNLAKTMEERKKALAAKAEFLNNMSHEMRTPVLGFTTISEGLVENWNILNDEKKFKYVQDIANSAQRLGSLISNILDLSTFVTNKIHMNFTKVNFNVLIEEAIEEAKTLYTNDKEMHINYTPLKEAFVEVDKEWIVQVLHHLFSNAAKFNSSKGLISIALKKSADSLHFSIVDTGVGVPESEIKDIFIPFTQSTRTKTGAGGRGLGLALCKEIIEAHNGKIWVENNVAQGATFHFTIPIIHE